MSIAQRSAVTTWEVRWPPAADRSSMTRALSGDVTWATRTGARDGMTSPEELAAAVDASCFAMALVLRLGEGGAVPQGLRVEATVALDEVDGVPTIISSHLVVRARVTGFDGDRFQRAVDEAVALCPISLVPWCPGALVPKPPSLDWAQAACLMLAGTTACQCVTATDVRQGDSVVIHGAPAASASWLSNLPCPAEQASS